MQECCRRLLIVLGKYIHSFLVLFFIRKQCENRQFSQEISIKIEESCSRNALAVKGHIHYVQILQKYSKPLYAIRSHVFLHYSI